MRLTCFTINTLRYHIEINVANSILKYFFLGSIVLESSTTTSLFNLLCWRKHPLPKIPCSTSVDATKKIIKAMCLLWSSSVSTSFSNNNITCRYFLCLSLLTKLTINFGLGVLPLGLYMTPTHWGLPKPVLTGRNAQSAKTFNEPSYRQQESRTTVFIDKGNTICYEFFYIVKYFSYYQVTLNQIQVQLELLCIIVGHLRNQTKAFVRNNN